jgi:putative ABC transport system substrate-binding protein
MRRRQFITLLSGAAAWPLAARGQQASKLPTIGLLGASTPSGTREWTDAFVLRLRDLGWIEGRTIAIEYRWTEGHRERSVDFISEFTRLHVAVIVTHGAANILAAKRVTSTIPIVFAAAGDPIGSGLVASLARPGGNITGMSMQLPDVAAKRIGLLREFVPGLRRLAIIANADAAGAVLDKAEAEASARTLGLEVATFEIRRADDIAAAIGGLKGSADALYVASDPLMATYKTRINTLALGGRLPTMYDVREYVESGGLMSYGPNLPDLWRRAADFVDKILRGTKPADIPVEQPTRFDLVINLTTAKALGLAVPDELHALATEVIE